MDKPASNRSKSMNIFNFFQTCSSSNENLSRTKSMQTNNSSASIIHEGSERRGSFEMSKEPTSPKVSCIGNVEHKKNTSRRNNNKRSTSTIMSLKNHVRKFSIRKMFQRKVKPGRESSSFGSDDHEEQNKIMKSSRELDWRKVQVDDDYTHFASIVIVLEPKKEVNIWKRRSMVPPTPLQLNL